MIAQNWQERMRLAQQHIKQLEQQIADYKKQVEEKDLIIYGITEGAEEWKAKCSDLQWRIDNHIAKLATHTEAEAVEFKEWCDNAAHQKSMIVHNGLTTAQLYKIFKKEKENG